MARAATPYKDWPDIKDIDIPPDSGLSDGELVTLSQGGASYLNSRTGAPQIFRVRVMEQSNG